MSSNSNAPVIIRRKKIIAAEGHHGGAWKVAYADFVTAMMAFFMLMWLLNATTEQQRAGLADYFNPTVPIIRSSGGGSGTLNGTSVNSENTLVMNGHGNISDRPADPRAAPGQTGIETRGEEKVAEAHLERVEQVFWSEGGESYLDDNERRHVTSRLTDEGLVLEFYSRPEEPLFTSDDRPTKLLRSLLRSTANVSGMVTNGIAVEGFVAAQPVVTRNPREWERSTNRARNAREMLEIFGISKERLMRVTGHADRDPATSVPTEVRNDRLEITFLRNDR